MSEHQKHHLHENIDENQILIDSPDCHSFIDSIHSSNKTIHDHDHSNQGGLSCRLISMIILTGVFFFAELITGFITRSLALQSDAFHMFSDEASLIIGLIAHKLSKYPPTNLRTFGWARSEVLGGLVNAVFLLAICLTIFFDAIIRFIEVETIQNPVLFLIVGTLGLIVNLIGIFLFRDNTGHSDNIEGIFLHVIGDFLGSIGVMISACVIQFTDWKYKNYVDPAISLIIVFILIHGSFKLFIKTAKTVLESTPADIDVDLIYEEMMKIEGMITIHELHIWQLSSKNYLATLHIVVDSKSRNQQIHSDSTNVLMKNGIFSSTIQIEFSEDFPAGINHEGSCFYASSFGSDKRCFISHPVYQHGIGCPHINLTNIKDYPIYEEVEENHHSNNSLQELA
jgi:zinc transporter 1